jgi:RNA polymerase sigma factor (sigma-70 family)
MSRDLWQKAVADLALWHTERARPAARSALTFIEAELRLAVPPLVRRTWPAEQLDDVLREFLTRLLDRPLPDDIDDPRHYLVRAFRNRCIDQHRAQQRRQEVAFPEPSTWEPPDPSPTASEHLQAQERARALQAALDSLSVADRVAMKLVDAPEWLDDVELAWLSERAGVSLDAVLSAVRVARDVFALTELFDPATPGGADDRRQRMERFRRRRGRARDKLREILDAGGGDR